MQWNRQYLIKSYISASLWFVPFIAVLLYWVVSRITHGIGDWLMQTGRIDETTAFFGFSMAGARSALETVVTLNLSFLVFTFGSLLVAIQVAGGQYTPRIIATGINETTGKWVELGYFPYEIIHKKWQYALLTMLKTEVPTPEMATLINELYEHYPKGLVAHVTKGTLPEQCRGLAKYVASPPIAVNRIISYTGAEVTYWYQDHRTKGKEEVTVPVMTFIGRMVQHILPKGFQRIRYYGLQSTRTFQKWVKAIKEGLLKIGRQRRRTVHPFRAGGAVRHGRRPGK